LLAMPLFDTVGIMIRRMLKGRSPFAADREHFHHAFQLAGFSVFRTQVTITAMATIFMVIGLVGQFASVSEIAMFYLFLGVFGLYFWGMMRAWKVMRFLRRAMHLDRDRNQRDTERAPEPALFRDGHVEDLRAYYLKHRAEHLSNTQDEGNSKVELKLVVNADNPPKTDNSNSTSTPES